MEFSYEGLDGEIYFENLVPVQVNGLILHATPDINIPSILENGLLTTAPRTLNLLEIQALFCTVPSDNAHTRELFRYYDDWSVVVIDCAKIQDVKWYRDFLAEDETGTANPHIMTFSNIPPEAIVKIIK